MKKILMMSLVVTMLLISSNAFALIKKQDIIADNPSEQKIEQVTIL